MLMSQGSLGVFFSNWLVGPIMAVGLVALFWPLVARVRTRLHGA
jgi:putative tricarboxylic transport membrane protein